MAPVTGEKPRKVDGNLAIRQACTHLIAQVIRAYRECSDEVQGDIDELLETILDPSVATDEREFAMSAIAEALFPSGDIGVDLEQDEPESAEENAIAQAMDEEEAKFAARVMDLMQSREMKQGDLAAASGVGQSAISMMLARKCRPQRRTVEKLAKALNVAPEELWPGYGR